MAVISRTLEYGNIRTTYTTENTALHTLGPPKLLAARKLCFLL